MSANSKIEWCDHTFNPWEGCQRVGPGCDNCYAEKRNARFAGGQAINWGPGAPRRRTSASNWAKPKTWNAAHAEFFAQHGRRQRVFCASLADVFDNAVPINWFAGFLDLCRLTPNLDKLLLTKRIGNVTWRLAEAMEYAQEAMANPLLANWICSWLDGDAPPTDVWIGGTIVNQAEADRDIPKLLAVPAAKRFLSMEPLLGPVDLDTIYNTDFGEGQPYLHPLIGRVSDGHGDGCNTPSIDWVIVGGESGPGARPMHPDWSSSLRNQCVAAGVPFLFKQWGEWKPICQMEEAEHDALYKSCVTAKPHEDQGNLDDIYGRWCTVQTTVLHIDGSTHGFTEPMAFQQGTKAMQIFKIGKKAAGRLLDGRTWNGFPKTTS
jgi:protein gp37